MRAVAGRRLMTHEHPPTLEEIRKTVYGEGSAEQRLVKIINGAWPVLEAQASTDLARQMLRSQFTHEAINGLPWQEFVESLHDVTEPLATQVGRSVREATRDLGPAGAKLSFNNIDAVSVKYAETQGAKLIVNLQESQRAAIRTVIADALRGNHTVDEVARILRGSIGLHPAWAEAVVKFRERTTARLIKDGMPEARAKLMAERKTEAYRKRLVKRRALNIARTEIQTASNLGRYATWAQMIGEGVMKPSSQKEWAPGPNACPLCAGMAGEIVTWDRQFSNGSAMPPAHPGCRCTAVLIPAPYKNKDLNPQTIDWLSPTLPYDQSPEGYAAHFAAETVATVAPAVAAAPTAEQIKASAEKLSKGQYRMEDLADEDQFTQDLAEGIAQWTQGQMGMAQVRAGGTAGDALREGLAAAPRYNADLYRGMMLEDEDLAKFARMSKGDVIPVDTAASFTSSRNIAENYMWYDDEEEVLRGVLIHLQDGRGLRVGKLGRSGGDEEIIVGHNLVVSAVRVNPDGMIHIVVREGS